MLKLIPQLLLVLCLRIAPTAVNAADDSIVLDVGPKIVGGNNADPTRYPYYTFLALGNEICSGTLIWEDIILTAAHCFRSIDTVTAYVNRTSRELTGNEYERSVIDFRQHPDYMAPTFSTTEQNDILLYKLSSPVDQVKRIRLNTDGSVPIDDAPLTVMGFGLRSENSAVFPSFLQDAEINKVSFDDCNDEASYTGEIIDKQMICASAPGKDACLGDSGGPLVDTSNDGEDIQVGLVSFGEGCADPNFPGGYMRISHYAPWIESQICELSSNPPSSCSPSLNSPGGTTAPATSKPVVSPVTTAPVTPKPVLSPTLTPVTPQPFLRPTTSAPITTQPTVSPTASPKTAQPVASPTAPPIVVLPIPPPPVPAPAAPNPLPTLRLDPQCEDCFCIADDEAQCPTDETDITQAFDATYIAAYESFVPTTTIPLQDENGGACYPFADAVGPQIDYPESNRPQCQRSSDEGVCAFVFSDAACQGRSYSMQTFASSEVVTTNAIVTHKGECGVCSSAQDLATRMKTLESFETELDGCRARYVEGSFDVLQSCFEELGFTSGCATFWSHTVATTARVCSLECRGGSTGPPFNSPIGDCELNSCLQCVADKFGTDLKRVAGRSMPASGIVEQVARPCSQFFAVDHDPCPVFEAPELPPLGVGGGGGFCFSGETTVQVNDSRGTISMKDLKLGDEILVDTADHFEAVYSFGHRQESAKAEYLQLQPSMVELSSDHLVFVQNKGIVPAGLVEVGDVLEGDGAVSAIRKIERQGVFAPFTPSGTIMVNGVQVSCYVAFQQSEFLEIGSTATPISFQWVAHTFQTPHRLWCHHLGRCVSEQYTEDGVSEWVAVPHEMALWLLVQHPVILAALLIPFLLLMVSFVLLNFILLRPFECCLWIISTIITMRRINGTVLKKAS